MNHRIFSLTLAIFGAIGCGGVGSEEDARRAYEGVDGSIDTAIQLGFDGFNSASSANISAQTAKGAKGGTITVTGKVDQGASSNKTMDLDVAMSKYSEDGLLVYDTDSQALPALSMKLSDFPNGTLDGTLAGKFTLSSDLEGEVTLALALSGDLEPVPTDASKVQRKPGTTHITGTATSEFGTFSVDVTQ